MKVRILFFTDHNCQYAVKVGKDKKQICVNINGEESLFNPDSNTYTSFHNFMEEIEIPNDSNENDAIIARLKILIEENKNLPTIDHR